MALPPAAQQAHNRRLDSRAIGEKMAYHTTGPPLRPSHQKAESSHWYYGYVYDV